MRRRARTAATAAIVAATAAAAWTWAAPWYAEREAKSWATKRGMAVEIGSVRVHPQAVELGNVHVRSPYFPGQDAVLDKVEVSLDGAAVKKVSVDGGRLSLSGTARDLHSMYERWAEGREHRSGRESTRSRQAEARGVNVTWSGPDGEGSAAEADSVSWKNGKLRAESAKAEIAGKKIEATKASIKRVDEGFELEAETVHVWPVKAAEKPDKDVTERLRTVRIPDHPIPATVKIGHLEAEVWGRTFKADGLVIEPGSLPRVDVSAKSLEIPGKLKFVGFGTSARVGNGTVEGKLWFNSVETAYPAITDSKIETGRAEVEGRLSLSGGADADVDMRLGKAKAHATAKVDTKGVKVQVDMPDSGCQDVLDSVPSALVRTIMPGAKLSGTVSARLQVGFSLPKRRPAYARLKLKNGCVVEALPDGISAKALQRPFERKALGYDKKERTVRTGPGSQEWVSIQLVSRYVPLALETMEDPGFMGHRGFEIGAIENSIIADIEEGRFARGASTITMQLAKNLWLNREKTLSRKLQEAVLTTYLEQALSKDRILELYMNVVEFGPGVYGIKAASRRYFGANPMRLTLSQSLLLASVLPRPNGAYFGPDGKVQEGRLALIRRIMKAMRDTQKISQDEYEEGIREVPREGAPETGTGAEDAGSVKASQDGLAPDTWQAD